jgi:hypothetical protein
LTVACTAAVEFRASEDLHELRVQRTVASSAGFTVIKNPFESPSSGIPRQLDVGTIAERHA